MPGSTAPRPGWSTEDAGTNRLERVADVPPLVTDGAFLPDGRFVLRSYTIGLRVRPARSPGRVGRRCRGSRRVSRSPTTASRSLLVGSEGEDSAVYRCRSPATRRTRRRRPRPSATGTRTRRPGPSATTTLVAASRAARAAAADRPGRRRLRAAPARWSPALVAAALASLLAACAEPTLRRLTAACGSGSGCRAPSRRPRAATTSSTGTTSSGGAGRPGRPGRRARTGPTPDGQRRADAGPGAGVVRPALGGVDRPGDTRAGRTARSPGRRRAAPASASQALGRQPEDREAGRGEHDGARRAGGRADSAARAGRRPPGRRTCRRPPRSRDGGRRRPATARSARA